MARRTGSRFAGIRGKLKQNFLEALAQTGIITDAAQAAGVARETYYYWAEHDDAFATAAAAAKEMAADRLEKEMVRRAVDGVSKPVYQGGELVGAITEYSDTLLIFALKAMRPEKYRERHDYRHAGADGSPLIPLSVLREALADAEADSD